MGPGALLRPGDEGRPDPPSSVVGAHVGLRSVPVHLGPRDRRLAGEHEQAVGGGIEPIPVELHLDVGAIDLDRAVEVELGRGDQFEDRVDVVGSCGSRGVAVGQLDHEVLHPGHRSRPTGPGITVEVLQLRAHVVEGLPRRERHAVGRRDLHEPVLGEHDVRVQGAVAVGRALADERHPAPPSSVQDRVHLARAASDALAVPVAERHPRLAVLRPRVGDHPHVLETRGAQDRRDVEAEAVRDERHGDVVVRQPRDERRERRVDGAVVDREGQQPFERGVEHRRLRRDDAPRVELAPLPGRVELGPGRVAELDQQMLGDVVQTRRAVEVHQDRADREHDRTGYRSTGTLLGCRVRSPIASPRGWWPRGRAASATSRPTCSARRTASSRACPTCPTRS